VLPFLNGMAHTGRLDQEFPDGVLGGLVKFVATMDGDSVRQLTDLTTGDGGRAQRGRRSRT
jgi:ketopantoate reductase